MNVKQYLNQIKKLDRQIQNKKLEIESLRSLATSISIATDSEKVQSSGASDKLGNTVAKIVDFERELNDMIVLFVNKQQKVSRTLDEITDANIYDVMHKRYIQYMTFDDIAEDMHFTRQWITELHKRGLYIVRQLL